MNIAAQSPLDRVAQTRVEAVRTALTLAAGLVGVVALVLTSRKQWLAEHSQRHAEYNASEQRAADLFASAAEQLASDKAPVRLAGLYSLEHLGQNNPKYRNTVINIFCAYLRMPFAHPANQALAAESSRRPENDQRDSGDNTLFVELGPALANSVGAQLDTAHQIAEERQVRETAQSLLSKHLTFIELDTNEHFWGDSDGNGPDLDLSGATLENWDLRKARIGKANFKGAALVGQITLDDSRISGGANFWMARFFLAVASFERVTFGSTAAFYETDFRNATLNFTGAVFLKDANFIGAKLPPRNTTFRNALFHGSVELPLEFKSRYALHGAKIMASGNQLNPPSLPVGWNLGDHLERDERSGALWRRIIHEDD